MIWMSDPDKEGIFFNKGWLEFTGRSAEQEWGRVGWKEFTPKTWRTLLTFVGRPLQTGAIHRRVSFAPDGR